MDEWLDCLTDVRLILGLAGTGALTWLSTRFDKKTAGQFTCYGIALVIAFAMGLRVNGGNSVRTFKPSDEGPVVDGESEGVAPNQDKAPLQGGNFPLEFAQANGLTAADFAAARNMGMWRVGNGGLEWVDHAIVLERETATGKWNLSSSRVTCVEPKGPRLDIEVTAR